MIARPARRGLIVAVAALALVATACGGEGPSSNPPAASAAGSSPAAGATSAGPRTEVDSLQVSAKDFSFSLNLTSLHPGPPGVDVVLTNDGATPHTLTFYSDPDFKTKIPKADSGSVAPGGTAAFPFIVPDGLTTVYFRCDIHPTQMTGQLAVQ